MVVSAIPVQPSAADLVASTSASDPNTGSSPEAGGIDSSLGSRRETPATAGADDWLEGGDASSEYGNGWARTPPSSYRDPDERPNSGRSAGKIAAAVIVVFLLLLALPVPLPFGTTLAPNALNISYSQLGSSNCVSISGSWSTTDGGSVSFLIINSANSTMYSADASSGSFSFGGFDGPYVAGAYSLLPETVQVSGICWAPVLNIGLP